MKYEDIIGTKIMFLANPLMFAESLSQLSGYSDFKGIPQAGRLFISKFTEA